MSSVASFDSQQQLVTGAASVMNGSHSSRFPLSCDPEKL